MTTTTPLVIAAHGTRDPEGTRASRDLLELVRAKLPDTQIELGFVELDEPTVGEAVASVLDADDPHAVVVPLMVGTGGHVRRDIPNAINEGTIGYPGADVGYAEPLGDHHLLREALTERIVEAIGDWEPKDTAAIVLGRGARVPEANANHARLARLVYEELNVSRVLPAFIQVTRPSVPEALNDAYAVGARQIVIGANFLFPGMLQRWLAEQVDTWCVAHPDTEVRIAGVIGACDQLAQVVVDRYHGAQSDPRPAAGSPAFLTGLLLHDRDVLVVGAGRVADRRIPRLVEAGAKIRIVSPTLSIRLRRLARSGAVTWIQRGFTDDDLQGAWFVMALSNDPQVNAQVADGAEQRHTYCVRADDARLGSAWTPAVDRAGGMTVAVIGQRDPRRSATVRDELLRVLQG